MADARELMSKAKFYNDYSRFLDKENRYETWEESVHRVMDMHRKFYKDKMTHELSILIDDVEDAYGKEMFLGAQRALQFGGDQLLKHHARLYNCASSYANRPDFFGGLFYLLLCGCGVGFSVQKQHISMLPKIQKREKQPKTFVVEDSIEGWASSIDVLLSSYFKNGGLYPEYKGKKVYFDLSKIRPKGSYISGGFKAPGSEALRSALDKIELLIESELEKGEEKLRSIVVYDICMHIADSVISGGVRRSATICIFSKDDKDMLSAKTGDWFVKNPQRSRSNNSILLLREGTTKEEFVKFMNNAKEFGEPAVIWTDSLEFMFNPCVTGDTTVFTSDGIKTVSELVGKPFKAIVNGKEYKTLSDGFWKTGTKEVFNLITKEGYELRLTENHKLLSIVDGKECWKELKDLKVNDKIKIHNHSSYEYIFNQDEYEKGWVIGNLVGDGTFLEDGAILRYWDDDVLNKKSTNILQKHFKTYKNFLFKTNKDKNIQSHKSVLLKEMANKLGIFRCKKEPNVDLERANFSFLKGYLQGLFDADGSVQGNYNKGHSIRLTQSNKNVLKQVQRILLRFGINSKIYQNRRPEGFYKLPDGYGGKKDYFCNEISELIISKDNLTRFYTNINFSCDKKKQKLESIVSGYKRNAYKDKFEVSISEITSDGFEEVYDVTVDEVHCFDANGIVAHNCVEISMLPKFKEDGTYGFQMCNLTEINGGLSTTKEIFFEQCKFASILGTLQAGYTDFKFLKDSTKKIVDKEALIGVGITGMVNNPEILFNEEILKEGAKVVKYWNEYVSKIIGINSAARTTTIKPSGNASVLLKCASGIHGEHSPKYIRNVQFNKDTEVSEIFIRTNKVMCENSIYNDKDIVVSFPIQPKKDSVFKSELLGTKQLDLVKLVQNSWIEEGTKKELCNDQKLRHNVSNTITVDDWDVVIDYIYENRNSLCGVSLLALVGDKAYPQAPFTEILGHQDVVSKYGEISLFTSALIEAGLNAFNEDLWRALNTCLGFGEILSEEKHDLLKRDFVRRFDKFSKNFSSKEECSNCLKDVYNLHKYWKIVSNMKQIDWSKELKKKDFVDINTTASQNCHGGACEIRFH